MGAGTASTLNSLNNNNSHCFLVSGQMLHVHTEGSIRIFTGQPEIRLGEFKKLSRNSQWRGCPRKVHRGRDPKFCF